MTVLQLPNLGDLFVDASLLCLEALDRSIEDRGSVLTSMHVISMTLKQRVGQMLAALDSPLKPPSRSYRVRIDPRPGTYRNFCIGMLRRGESAS